MTDTETPIASLIEKAEKYTSTTIELLKLNAIIANIVARHSDGIKNLGQKLINQFSKK